MFRLGLSALIGENYGLTNAEFRIAAAQRLAGMALGIESFRGEPMAAICREKAGERPRSTFAEFHGSLGRFSKVRRSGCVSAI